MSANFKLQLHGNEYFNILFRVFLWNFCFSQFEFRLIMQIRHFWHLNLHWKCWTKLNQIWQRWSPLNFLSDSPILHSRFDLKWSLVGKLSKLFVTIPFSIYALEVKLKTRWAITGSWEPLVLIYSSSAKTMM